LVELATRGDPQSSLRWACKSTTRLAAVEARTSLAGELRLALRVCYFPHGASKWNRIKHRMFCYITQNWRGRALVNWQAVVNLIGQTTTAQDCASKRSSIRENTNPESK
jgi:hypothetical protein